MQKARRHTVLRHGAPTACRRVVSGSLSLPCQGCFSPFPYGTSSLSVVYVYLALDDGPPRFQQDFTCPAVLRRAIQSYTCFRLRDYHPLRSAFQSDSANKFGTAWFCKTRKIAPYNPTRATLTGLHTCGLGSSPFARRY